MLSDARRLALAGLSSAIFSEIFVPESQVEPTRKAASVLMSAFQHLQLLIDSPGPVAGLFVCR
jgi:hypothetical protein